MIQYKNSDTFIILVPHEFAKTSHLTQYPVKTATQNTLYHAKNLAFKKVYDAARSIY